MKKCETCEQRWKLERYSGYPRVTEITISNETDKTVTVYEDRGPFGASTRRMDKVSSYHSVHKTEYDAWQAVHLELQDRLASVVAVRERILVKLEEAQAKIDALAQPAE